MATGGAVSPKKTFVFLRLNRKKRAAQIHLTIIIAGIPHDLPLFVEQKLDISHGTILTKGMTCSIAFIVECEVQRGLEQQHLYNLSYL